MFPVTTGVWGKALTTTDVTTPKVPTKSVSVGWCLGQEQCTTTTAASERPEEIFIQSIMHLHNPAIGSDRRHSEHIICSKTIVAGKTTMSSTLQKSTCDTDRTPPSNNHSHVLLAHQSASLIRLSTRSILHGSPCIITSRRNILSLVCNAFEIVRPDTQRVPTDALSIEVVSGVLDHEADVVVPRKVDGELYMAHILRVDDVDWPASLCACGIWLRCWCTAIRGRPLRHDACRVFRAWNC